MKLLSKIIDLMLIRKVIRCLAVFLILYSIINDNYTKHYQFTALIVLTLLLLINDSIRERYLFRNNNFGYNMSLIASNIFLGLLLYQCNSFAIQVYFIILLAEIMAPNNKFPFFLVALNLLTFILANSGSVNIKDILLPYTVVFLVIYIFRYISIERIKVVELNKELKNTNLMLEELTISKERTRIAQELHDSIGHSLIALSMNLEYAENMLDIDVSKTKTVIHKSYDLSKVCINDLRKAVHVLKDNNSLLNLQKSITNIIKNFSETDSIKFTLEINEQAEAVNPDIKNCIYKTVLEAVTNGIKHGNATLFSIKIDTNSKEVLLKVSNNGKECTSIRKSTGLSGIENRISALKGKVCFYSEKGRGFTLEACIPYIDE